MQTSINPETARLLCLIAERIMENHRELKPPVRYVHLNASERGAIAPRMVFREERGRRVPSIFGLEIRAGIGGVQLSG